MPVTSVPEHHMQIEQQYRNDLEDLKKYVQEVELSTETHFDLLSLSHGMISFSIHNVIATDVVILIDHMKKRTASRFNCRVFDMDHGAKNHVVTFNFR